METVTLKYDPTWQALEWAKAHCPGYVTNQSRLVTIQGYPDKSIGMSKTHVIDYYFTDGGDATLFRLRWL